MEKKIALFIDCENISHKHIQKIIEELANYGEINICKAYGDWKNRTLNGWNDKLFDYSLEPIHQPPYTSTKNATDIKMTVDIMKVMCQNTGIDFIALATSDSDFTPLVTEIKSQGIQVIGFGEEKTCKVLQKACSMFIEVEKKVNKSDLENNNHLIKMLNKAVNNKKGKNDFSLVAEVGTYIKNKYSTNALKYGYRTWGEVFRCLDNYYEISMIEKNGNKSTMTVKPK